MKKLIVSLAVLAAVAVPMGVHGLDSVAEAKPMPKGHEGLLVAPEKKVAAEINLINEYYGTSASELKKYYDIGWNLKELRHASFLAAAANKDLGTVLQMKSEMKWPRVEYLLGMTPNDIKAARDKYDAQYMQKKLDVAYAEAFSLLQKNYSKGDVAHALLMSKYTTEGPEKIIAMHNPPACDWDAVAAQLNITEDIMAEIRTLLEEMRP